MINIYNPPLILLTDGYKMDHRRQYPDDTQFIYSNFTARASRTPAREVVFFGLQYLLKHYFQDLADVTFFSRPKEEVVDEYKRATDNYLGPNEVGVEHIAALHDYGRIPLEFRALPEGTRVPLRLPMFTIENTHPDFFWVTNYFETLISTCLWLGCTSATTAYMYRQLLSNYAGLTGTPQEFVPYQAHDFSFRGMGAPEAALISGGAHLLSFDGTDTVPAIPWMQHYYNMPLGFGPSGVPATEHSVMCAGGETSEIETFRRLLKLYPTGILSVVSDTWDFWNVLENILPQLKEEIMARNGKLVIRPDSGDPVKIVCGDPKSPRTVVKMGAIEWLWRVFGGTTTSTGYNMLDSHIGLIYGDSITLERADQICNGLAEKRFASGNIVFGIGSYTYQYNTRDTYGFAIKATWAMIKGQEHILFKAPKTDDGTKFSARGRIVINRNEDGNLALIDNLTLDQQSQYDYNNNNLLKKVWSEGRSASFNSTSFEQVRKTLRG